MHLWREEANTTQFHSGPPHLWVCLTYKGLWSDHTLCYTCESLWFRLFGSWYLLWKRDSWWTLLENVNLRLNSKVVKKRCDTFCFFCSSLMYFISSSSSNSILDKDFQLFNSPESLWSCHSAAKVKVLYMLMMNIYSFIIYIFQKAIDPVSQTLTLCKNRVFKQRKTNEELTASGGHNQAHRWLRATELQPSGYMSNCRWSIRVLTTTGTKCIYSENLYTFMCIYVSRGGSEPAAEEQLEW